jgi:hypothetical protein
VPAEQRVPQLGCRIINVLAGLTPDFCTSASFKLMMPRVFTLGPGERAVASNPESFSAIAISTSTGTLYSGGILERLECALIERIGLKLLRRSGSPCRAPRLNIGQRRIERCSSG